MREGNVVLGTIKWGVETEYMLRTPNMPDQDVPGWKNLGKGKKGRRTQEERENNHVLKEL